MSKSNGVVLMLEGSEASKPSWRRGEELIDSLPYVDELSEQERAEAELLIRKEAARGDKRVQDYLAELPSMPESRFAEHPILQAELERVARGEPMAPMDASRYSFPIPPVNKRQDPKAWQLALDNAQAQLEHQYTRLLNLELMIKYGPNVWRSYNAQLDSVLRDVQAELDTVRAESEEVNKQRKLFQMGLKSELDQLEREWFEHIQKNLGIESACRALEREVESLRSQMEATQTSHLEAEDARGE